MTVPAEPERDPYQPFPAFTAWQAVQFDADVFERFADVLATERRNVGEDHHARAVTTATKWAAIDTGAIEGLYDVDRGFTYTVAAEAAAWESIHKLKGEDVAHAIADALAGYEYVLDLATGSRPVSEQWIKELHSVLCASQETHTVITAVGPQQHDFVKGSYKTQPNNPLNLATNKIHEYAPVEDTAAEMHRFVQELQSEEFGAAHPVLQAAYAHYAFVCIHPFADGNGRVSRALASVFLYRRPGIPLVVFADQKGDYLDALEAADAGNAEPFLNFVSDRAVDTMQMVLAEARRQPGPSLSERVKQLQGALVGRGGLPHEQINAVAASVLNAFREAMSVVLNENPLDQPLSAAFVNVGGAGQTPPGFRAPGAPAFGVRVHSNPPAEADAIRSFGVFVARPETTHADFVVKMNPGELIVLECFLREATPTIGHALAYRARIAAEEIFVAQVTEVATAGEDILRKGGFA